MTIKTDFDYQVQLIQFHNGKIKECVTPNEDGSYTIFIEANLSREEQQKAFLHAISHIMHRDFEKKCSAGMIEWYAHQ